MGIVQKNQLADSLKYTNPDSALALYNECKKEYLKTGDTLTSIQVLIEISSIYSSNANYAKSYDGFWEALILSHEISDSTLNGAIYDGIALLYSLFYRNQEAEEYINKALRLKKKLISLGNLDPISLNHTYYIACIHYREIGHYDLAGQYLDSCRIVINKIQTTDDHERFIQAEQAYLHYHEGNYSLAKIMLLDAKEKFVDSYQTFQVIILSYLGDVYMKLHETNESENYYLQSLQAARKYRSHRNYIPLVYQKLSELYLQINKKDQAYAYLQKAKSLNDSIFGAKSINNAYLLEIKDEYRVAQEKQKETLSKMQINDLEQQKNIFFLRNVILSISLASILIIAFVVFRQLRSKHKTEQAILKGKQSITEQKNKEIIEIKNKELTSSALQLIEKDELLMEVKNEILKLKAENSSPALNSILSKIKSNSKQDWEEFNARFTSVNESFYQNLSERFPSLTQKDQKLCALIKLNFSSKEMAQLLGISVESVHTSRYRLRKKMNLEKKDNLEEFIAHL